MFPMIILRRLTNAQPGSLAWVDSAARKRYLINAVNGPGPIARDWNGKTDEPLTNIPAGYEPPSPKPKPASFIDKTYQKARGKGKGK